MTNYEEYDKLVKQRSDVQSQYNAAYNRIEEYQYNLRRLRPVKEVIKTQKANFREINNTDKNCIEKKYSWIGQNYNTFKSNGANLIDENQNYLKYSLDHVLDSLNNEITRLENLILKEQGVLGYLGSALNSLGNAIENFFN